MAVRFEELYADATSGTALDEILAFAGADAAAAVRPVDDAAGRRAQEEGPATKRTTTERRQARRRLLAHKMRGRHGNLPPKVRRYLEHLYEPFNGMLTELLGEEWRGVWDV